MIKILYSKSYTKRESPLSGRIYRCSFNWQVFCWTRDYFDTKYR